MYKYEPPRIHILIGLSASLHSMVMALTLSQLSALMKAKKRKKNALEVLLNHCREMLNIVDGQGDRRDCCRKKIERKNAQTNKPSKRYTKCYSSISEPSYKTNNDIPYKFSPTQTHLSYSTSQTQCASIAATTAPAPSAGCNKWPVHAQLPSGSEGSTVTDQTAPDQREHAEDDAVDQACFY